MNKKRNPIIDLPSNRRFTPKKFFPKIKNSTKEFKSESRNKKKSSSKNRYLKISPSKFAISLGLINALIVFITTLTAIGAQSLSTITPIILQIYGNFGYSVSFLGSIIGSIYIFIDTFLIIYLFIWIYNKLI